ncbi:putative protein kinase-like domain superfamily [Helianthus annuus]|nr:putative protein kinase-like domain superfamily [Helianthus annuus]
MQIGSSQYDLGSVGGQSLDGSFRKTESVISSRSASSSKQGFKATKEIARNLTDIDLFTQHLEEWVTDHSFMSPFALDELQNLDFALESVLFQQLHRMPCSPQSSHTSKEQEFLALEDFLHAITDSLWHSLWDENGPSPYSIWCPRYSGSKFYTVEKAIARRRLDSLCGAALVSRNESDPHVRWDQVVHFAVYRHNIINENELTMSSSSICKALFYAARILLSRTLSKYTSASNDCVYVLVLDSIFGGVVKLEGDMGKLELVSGNPYLSMVNWIINHAEVKVSQVDRIWNKLGNANWRDLGCLQIVLATYYSIVQWCGESRRSITSLATDHGRRLHQRRVERRLVGDSEKAIIPVDYDAESVKIVEKHIQDHRLKLEKGEILELEAVQDRFQIQELLQGWNGCCYEAFSLEFPTEPLMLYVGAHPTRLEPSWEDMSLWYQVQRQTKILNIFADQGICSKNLPQIVSNGRILHSGTCTRQSPKGRCDHPSCGTPILVVHPIGQPLSTKSIPFTSDDAIRCCRDCLSALKSAKSANVQHGDICPENIITTNGFYVLVSWGRAVLDDKDTSYSVDYDVWVERFNKVVDGGRNRGKVVEVEQAVRVEDVGESSGIGDSS